MGGSVTRVLASDLTALSSFLGDRLQYNTGPFENQDDVTPAKRYLLRTDCNFMLSFRYSFN